MIMFAFPEGNHLDSVFLPESNIYLYFAYSDHLDKNFLCTVSSDKEISPFDFLVRHRYRLRPILENYKALPYKRQSSVDELDDSSFPSEAKYFGFPWSCKHKSLNKMKNFHLNCKRYYVVVAYRRVGNEEKVVLLFDRYSDAISVVRDFSKVSIKDLLGSDFETYNGWYPYLWVEYMGSPISLLLDVSSHVGIDSLSPTWCHYLICFLKDGFISEEYLGSIFGFVYRDKFSQIINWDSNLQK
jgi:hypothetical protein